MSTILKTVSLFALLASSTLAYDPASRTCRGGLCLTSFRWCDGDDCYYPPNVYPSQVEDYQGPPAIIQWNPSTPYNITWRDWDENYPVTIRWNFPNATTGSQSVPAQWEYNTTVPSPGYYEWTPNSRDFPNMTNITSAEAEGLTASPLNIITISQPEAARTSGQYNVEFSIYTNMARLGFTDSTSQFIVLNSWATTFAQNYAQRVRNGYNHRIKLGVGIGVGLGVPVLIAVTTAITWFFARSRSRREVSKF